MKQFFNPQKPLNLKHRAHY